MGRGLHVRQPGAGVLTLTILTGLLWLAEGLLEASGAWLFWRRRISVLWIWLGFRALADFIGFLAIKISGPFLYSWVDYIQRNAQYVFLAAVCVSCVGQILRERPKTRRAHQAGLCAVAIAGIVLLHAKWPPTADMVRLFEAGAELFLGGFIVLALAMVNAQVPRPWGLISAGLLVLTVFDAAVTMLSRHNWDYWAGWYPVGAILSLGMLAWAGWRDYRLDEARLPLPAKKPPTCEDCSAKIMELYG